MNNNDERVFANANIVLADSIVHGCVRVSNGTIVDIDTTCAAHLSDHNSQVVDCHSDFLVPGLVELHTDHLENHYLPRPGVRWNMMSAIQAHDAQIASAGITTVYDCLRAGSGSDGTFDIDEMLQLGLALKQAASLNRLRADHRLHLRCEVSVSSMLEEFEMLDKHLNVALVSMMDHAPGQRQFTSLEAYAAYHQVKYQLSNEEFARFVERRLADSQEYSSRYRQYISDACRERQIPLASHDDATEAHVQESISHGVRIAEFPTTLNAAQCSNEAGLDVLMGAPNVVRGASHSGNVSARSLLEHQCLSVLSSDYVPSSLLSAAFLISQRDALLSLPEAICLISRNPAHCLGLTDRGEIAPGLQADLVRVAWSAEHDCAPHVKAVWRKGLRII